MSSQPCECQPVQEVDLIIRTGGECRLSDFLLWEGAYAELYFTEVMWPDFGRSELRAAISEFHGRERRFGSVPAASAAPTEPAHVAASAAAGAGKVPVAAAAAGR